MIDPWAPNQDSAEMSAIGGSPDVVAASLDGTDLTQGGLSGASQIMTERA